MHDFRDALGLVDLNCQLGHWLKQADQVEFLKGVFVVMPERRTTGNRHHWRMPYIRRGNASEQICRPWATGDQTHCRCPGDPCQAVGHKRRPLLVAHVDIFHALIVVEHVQNI